MNTHERLIRERFARRRCGSCGALLTPESVIVLARRSNAWLLMATCSACQHRGIFVASFPGSVTGPLSLSSMSISLKPIHQPSRKPLQAPPPEHSANEYAIHPHDAANQFEPIEVTNADANDPLDTPATPPEQSSSTVPFFSSLSTASPSSPHSSSAPITPRDVAAMRDFLTTFDGNFQRLFAPTHPTRHERPERHDPPPTD